MLRVTRSGDANGVPRRTRKPAGLRLSIVNGVEGGFDTTIYVERECRSDNDTFLLMRSRESVLEPLGNTQP